MCQIYKNQDDFSENFVPQFIFFVEIPFIGN